MSKVSRLLLSHLATPAPGQVKSSAIATTGENTSSGGTLSNVVAPNSAANSKNSNKSRKQREKLLQTESNDFKLVFISSGDSSKDSDQLNSSLENGAADTSLPNGGEFIGDMEYEDEMNASNANHQHHSAPALPPKTRQQVLNQSNSVVNHNNNKNLNQEFGIDRMSISTSGTSIRTAATRDRHSPILR